MFELEKSKKIEKMGECQVNKIDGHVMISYSWAQKPFARKIKEHVEKKGHKIWIDDENMGMLYK